MKNNIKTFRKQLNISQKQLGRHLRISQQAVSSIEKGESNVSPQKMIKICRFLGKNLNEVFPEMKMTENKKIKNEEG